MSGAITAGFAVLVNAAYGTAAWAAARRYALADLAATRSACAILAAGTLAECAWIAHAGVRSSLILALGAVLSGAAWDAVCGYVFDAITFPCLAALAGLAVVTGTAGAFASGVLCAGGPLLLLYAVTRGRGLGLGDVKLACCIGGAAGALHGIEAIGAAFVAGGACAAALLLLKRSRAGDEVRFAPYMAAGMAAVLVAGGRL